MKSPGESFSSYIRLVPSLKAGGWRTCLVPPRLGSRRDDWMKPLLPGASSQVETFCVLRDNPGFIPGLPSSGSGGTGGEGCRGWGSAPGSHPSRKPGADRDAHPELKARKQLQVSQFTYSPSAWTQPGLLHDRSSSHPHSSSMRYFQPFPSFFTDGSSQLSVRTLNGPVLGFQDATRG